MPSGRDRHFGEKLITEAPKPTCKQVIKEVLMTKVITTAPPTKSTKIGGNGVNIR